MKRLTIAAGLCAALLIGTILVTGCTTSNISPGPGTTAALQNTPAVTPMQPGTIAPQVTQNTGTGPVTGQGLATDSSGNTGDLPADWQTGVPVDPYNSASQPATLTPDSEELGDPIP